jgi:hypothetical protein
MAALAACGTLASCGGEPGTAADVLPVLPRAITEAEARLLDRGEQILLSRCMRRHGLRFWIVPTPKASQTALHPYVVDDIGWARKHGYGRDIERRLARAARADPNRRYFARLSPARRQVALRALNGARPVGLQAHLPSGIVVRRSDSSCTSQAERELYRDLPAWFRANSVTQNLSGPRATRVTVDPRFLRAIRRWAACMRARGHRYSTPLQARAALTRPAASQRSERQVAVAEARCARQTGLSATVERLDRLFGAIVNREFRSEIATARRLQLAALPRARALAMSTAGHP